MLNFLKLFQLCWPITAQLHWVFPNRIYIDVIVDSMATRKLSDEQIDLSISYWQGERSLWDSSSLSYSNADERKSALRRISDKMDGLDTGWCCTCLVDRHSQNYKLRPFLLKHFSVISHVTTAEIKLK